jgi:hypothetical protein
MGLCGRCKFAINQMGWEGINATNADAVNALGFGFQALNSELSLHVCILHDNSSGLPPYNRREYLSLLQELSSVFYLFCDYSSPFLHKWPY